MALTPEQLLKDTEDMVKKIGEEGEPLKDTEDMVKKIAQEGEPQSSPAPPSPQSEEAPPPNPPPSEKKGSKVASTPPAKPAKKKTPYVIYCEDRQAFMASISNEEEVKLNLPPPPLTNASYQEILRATEALEGAKKKLLEIRAERDKPSKVIPETHRSPQSERAGERSLAFSQELVDLPIGTDKDGDEPVYEEVRVPPVKTASPFESKSTPVKRSKKVEETIEFREKRTLYDRTTWIRDLVCVCVILGGIYWVGSLIYHSFKGTTPVPPTTATSTTTTRTETTTTPPATQSTTLELWNPEKDEEWQKARMSPPRSESNVTEPEAPKN